MSVFKEMTSNHTIISSFFTEAFLKQLQNVVKVIFNINFKMLAMYFLRLNNGEKQ